MLFPTQEALAKYLKAHPGADKSKHKVDKEESEKSHGDDDDLKHHKKLLSEQKVVVRGVRDKIVSALDEAQINPNDILYDDELEKLTRHLQSAIESHRLHLKPTSVTYHSWERANSWVDDIKGMGDKALKRIKEMADEKKKAKGGEKKASTLRAKVAALAKKHPEFRSVLVPILRKTAMEFTKKEWETYHKEHPGAKITDHKIVEKAVGKKPTDDSTEDFKVFHEKAKDRMHELRSDIRAAIKEHGLSLGTVFRDDKVLQGINHAWEEASHSVLFPGSRAKVERCMKELESVKKKMLAHLMGLGKGKKD